MPRTEIGNELEQSGLGKKGVPTLGRDYSETVRPWRPFSFEANNPARTDRSRNDKIGVLIVRSYPGRIQKRTLFLRGNFSRVA